MGFLLVRFFKLRRARRPALAPTGKLRRARRPALALAPTGKLRRARRPALALAPAGKLRRARRPAPRPPALAARARRPGRAILRPLHHGRTRRGNTAVPATMDARCTTRNAAVKKIMPPLEVYSLDKIDHSNFIHAWNYWRIVH